MQFYLLSKIHPEFSVFGGRIVPLWPCEPKEEILNAVSLGDAFAIHEPDIPDGPVYSGKIWGPNMAVRASIFRTGFRYDENIGPSKGNYIPGSESSFNMMLEKHGFKFYFSNKVVVQHQIRPEQLTLKWLKKRAYRFGKGRVAWEAMDDERTDWKKIGIFPRWYGSYLLQSHANYLISWISRNRTMRVKANWDAMIAYGMIVQTIRQHKHARSAKLSLVRSRT
jgi:hypothetical protein